MNIFLQFANWLLKPLHEDSGMPDEDSSVPELTDVVGVGTLRKQENLLTLNKPVSQNIVIGEENVVEIPALASQPFQFQYQISKGDATKRYFTIWSTNKATVRKPAWTMFQKIQNAGLTSMDNFCSCALYEPAHDVEPHTDKFTLSLEYPS